MLAVADGSAHLSRAMRSLEAAFLIGVEGVTEVWLVRHADCYRNMVEADDPPLSHLGREQARRLAERVRRRAIETARAITHDVVVDQRLVEIALEIDEDGTLDFQEMPDVAAARMRAVLNDVVSKHPGERVIIVGHGAAIIACLTDVMRLEPGQLRMLPYYTSVSTLRVLGDRWMVGSLGDVAHLE